MSDNPPTADALPDRRQPSARRPDSTEQRSDTLPCRESGTRPPFNEVSVLFPLLSIYTAGYLGLMIADFFLKRSLALPDGIMTIYIALLGAYAADKGHVTRQMVSDELKISRSVAGRLLSGMEAKGTIVRKGEGKGCYYVSDTAPTGNSLWNPPRSEHSYHFYVIHRVLNHR